MIVEPYKKVIITRPSIVEFLSKYNDDSTHNKIEGIIETICDTLNIVLQKEDTKCAENKVLDYLQASEARMTALIASTQGSTWSETAIEDLERVITPLINRQVDIVNHIPLATKGLISDALHESVDIARCLKAQTDAISGTLDGLSARITKYDHSIRHRGSEGEGIIFDMLSERLLSRDGYRIEAVQGFARSCDIVIKREGYPIVRIESKAHGKDTGEKVRQKEVEKFERDLMNTNDHGVLISLYSGIVGMGDVEIKQLANGKFAVYLGRNNYDIDIVVSMIQLLYKLDAITAQRDEEDGMITLSKDIMMKIKSLLTDYAGKINTVKVHLRDSVSLLNDLQMSMIEKMLLAGVEDEQMGAGGVVRCGCGKVFKTKGGYTNHKRSCGMGTGA